MREAPPLGLNPRACDRCGSCLAACPNDALKVGRTYLKVDWSRCDGCGVCARVCPRRAIVARGARGSRTGATTSGRERPAARPATRPAARATMETPRARSAAAKAAKASKNDAVRSRPGKTRQTRPPKGGERGGFQWTLLEAVAMLSVTFSAFTLKEVAPLLPALRTLPASVDTPVRIGHLALYYAIQVLVLVWLVRRRGGEPMAALGLRSSGNTFQHRLVSAGWVMVVLVLARSVMSLYAYLTSEFGLMPEATTDLPTLFGRNAWGFMAAIVMVVVIGPVVEEAVFRGVLLEGLSARLGAWPAILVQAALFAAFHRSVWMAVPMFVLGVGLGWLAHRRGGLWPSIAVHALFNAITVAAAFLVLSAG